MLSEERVPVGDGSGHRGRYWVQMGLFLVKCDVNSLTYSGGVTT